MRKISLKKALELYGATNIEVHRNYRYRSGFFEKNGQLYYFSVNINGEPFNNMLVRTAKDRKDYSGGDNTYPMESFLSDYGYVLDIPPSNCDFNCR